MSLLITEIGFTKNFTVDSVEAGSSQLDWNWL